MCGRNVSVGPQWLRLSTRDVSPSMKTKMKAAAIGRFGPPSTLKVREVPVPEPGPSEVLVALRSASVGPWDIAIREGEWRRPGRAGFPLVPGVDGAGIVVAKGARVRRFRLGDRVYGYEFGNPKGGFYAEYVAVNAKHVARVPHVLKFLEAGAAATTGLTALQGIDALDLRPRETLLIFGASGGVGTVAVQIARSRGVRVIATASGNAASALVRKLGATAVIDARRKDAIERMTATAPDGFDAVLAFAGGETLERCLDLLRAGARVAHPNGIEPAPRNRSGIKLTRYDAEADPKEFARLNRIVNAARVRIPIAKVFSLEQAAAAHRRLARGHIPGRMVLQIRRNGS
jgi:NADPH:quinone reductase